MNSVFKEYMYYLKVEKGLSENSIQAYKSDLEKLFVFLSDAHIAPEHAEREHLSDFMVELGSMGTPKTGLYLPEVLTVAEIDAMIAAIDLSKPEGQRNKAIIEMLYGSGLRVSELINLQLSRLNADEGYILVEGKGSKQRLVPV